jgi:hypothetical protein
VSDKGPTAAELKAKVSLVDVASAVVKLEKRGGEFWACCPFHSESTASFAIKDKAGAGEVFFCQGCGKSGDVITFIELHEHLSTAEAFKKVKELAGNTAWREEAKKVQATFINVADKPKKTFPTASWAKREAALLDNPEAIRFLTEDRGLDMETIKASHMGFVQSIDGFINAKGVDEKTEEGAAEIERIRHAGWICFPRIDGEKIVAVKMRGVAAKAFSQIAGMDPKALYNVDCINALEPVFVTEGELDAEVFRMCGFCAVSIPNANTKITPEWKVRLKQAAFIVLAGDNDGKAGSDAMRLLLNELGENTYLLLWPGEKDANDFFRNTCERKIETFQQKVNELVEAAKSSPVEGFMSLIQRLRTSAGTDGQNDPHRMHFNISALDDMAYIPVEDAGYFIIYSTYSGTGKSVFTTQMMLEEGQRGKTIVVYSPELSGSSYLALVAAQTLPERNINRSLIVTQADYNATADALDKPCGEDGQPFQYYVGHIMPGGDPLAFIESTLKIIRPQRFVIDTFPCVVVRQRGESMVDAEGRTAEALSALGKKYGCIFCLVGQSNKEAEDIKEKRRDAHGVLRGSRVLYDKAHAIFLLHRKRKENATGQDDLLESETLVKMEKNRTSGPGAQQIYLTYNRSRSRFYLQESQPCGTVSGESGNNQPQDDEPPIY